MKIVAIVGSLRKESYNRKIANFIKDRYKDKLEVEILLLDDVALFNEDIEENPPEGVKEFKEKIKESEGILFATPEYNYSIPGVLKNAIDWCSRVERVMADKPTFIVGAATGNIGTARCQIDLRKVLNSSGVSALNLPGNYVLIENAEEKFNEAGEFIDEKSIERLDKVVDNFIDWDQKVK